MGLRFRDQYTAITDSGSLNRKLDDSELDSADDEGRTDRVAPTVEDEEDDMVDEEDQRQLKLLDVDVARVTRPEGNEVCMFCPHTALHVLTGGSFTS